MRSSTRGVLALLLLGGLAASAHAAGAPIPPAPTRWVTDTAGFLSALQRAQFDAKLEAYQKQSGHQILVWIGETIGDAPLDDWAVRTFQAWKVGRKGFDDGLVMFILSADRKIDIEVGYGLEGTVPDAVASRIIRDTMAPRLRADDRAGAVQAGVDAILAAIEGKPVESPPGGTGGVSQPEQEPKPQSLLVPGILVGLFILLFLYNPRLALWLMWSVMSQGGGGRSGGGRSGGGGFSGGGGRSGGGGARGSW
jgi:uncharacterized protein